MQKISVEFNEKLPLPYYFDVVHYESLTMRFKDIDKVGRVLRSRKGDSPAYRLRYSTSQKDIIFLLTNRYLGIIYQIGNEHWQIYSLSEMYHWHPQHNNHRCPYEELISAKKTADQLGTYYLTKTLQQLVKAGYIHSERGPRRL